MRWFGAGALVVACLAARPVSGAPAAAKESPLAQVPVHAPVVIQVRGVERTKDRLLALVKTALPDQLAAAKEHIEQALKDGLPGGRKLEGIAPAGPIFIAFTELPKPGDNEPPAALIVRVTNYQDFLKGLLTEDERKDLKKDGDLQTTKVMGEDAYFLHRNSYAIVAHNKDVAEQFTKQQPGLDTKLDKATAGRLLESDVALYVDMTAVNKTYGDQIQQAQQQIEGFIGIAAAQAPEASKASIEMGKQVLAAFFQALKDSQAFLVTGEFRPEGLAVHFGGRVAAGSPSDAVLKGAEPTPLGELRNLPAGQLAYFSMKSEPAMMEALKPFIAGAYGGQDDNKDVQQGLDLLNQAGAGVVYASYNIPVEGLVVSSYKNPQKAMQGQLKLIQAMKAGAGFQMAVLKEKPVVKENAHTYHGFKLTQVTAQLDWEKVAGGAPGAQEMADAMKKMFGGEEVRSWFGTDGKLFVTVNAKDWNGAKKLLDEYFAGKNKVGLNPAFEAARKQLPAAATMVGLVDLPRYAAITTEFIGPMFKALGAPFEIPTLKVEAGKTYVGFAVSLRPQHGSFDLWVPATTISEVHKMVQQFMPGAAQ
jgi:hypothetical protein